MIILNTPHNPTGKVFNLEELEMIAHLCKKYNVVCLADEVYEWVVYKPAKHIRIGKLKSVNNYYFKFPRRVLDFGPRL